jgi:hypothetical protein
MTRLLPLKILIIKADHVGQISIKSNCLSREGNKVRMMSKWLFVVLTVVLVLSADAKKNKKKKDKSGKGVEFTNYGPYFSLPVVVGSQKTKLNVGVDGFYGSSVVYGTGAACDGTDSYCVQHDTFDQT